MRPIGWIAVPLVLASAACDTAARNELRELAHADSLRVDSLVTIKNELLNEVMASTQFINEINAELAKVKSRSGPQLATTLTRESDIVAIKEERAAVLTRIRELAARLDSSERRVASLRERAASLAKRDSTIMQQVAAYERTIADLRMALDRQKQEYEATIAQQNQQIAALTSRVDTLKGENVRLAGERSALADSVAELTTEQNTVYYVIGTKDELVREGILVEEGFRRFIIFGGRSVAPSRDLDPSKFTKIDRTRDRVINFPEGEYRIVSRQNGAYASPLSTKGDKITGGIRIEQPERFWEASRFLIIVKS